MTIFSLFTITIVFLMCARKKVYLLDVYVNITALAIAYEIMISIGFFAKIKGFDIGYSEILIAIDTVICVLMFLKKQMIPNKKIFLTGMFFLVACLVSFLLQVIFPYKGGVVSTEANWDLYYFYKQYPNEITIGITHVKELVHVACYVFVMIQFFSLSHKMKQILLEKTFICCKPFIWCGLFELFMVKVFSARELLTRFQIALMGDSYINDSGVISLGVEDRLRGLKSEPSMYGFALFVFFCLAVFLFFKKRDKQYKIYAVISFVLMMLSKSFTAVVCCALIILGGILFIYKRGDIATKKTIIIGVISGCIIVAVCVDYFYKHTFESYYLKRIHMALVNLNDLSIDGWTGDYLSTDASTKVRLISIVGTLKYFLCRPFFGLALGSTYAHSTMATVLASIGNVGTVAWYFFTFKSQQRGEMINTVASLIWCCSLILLSNGLFPFYGVQNIIFSCFFSSSRGYTKIANISRDREKVAER